LTTTWQRKTSSENTKKKARGNNKKNAAGKAKVRKSLEELNHILEEPPSTAKELDDLTQGFQAKLSSFAKSFAKPAFTATRKKAKEDMDFWIQSQLQT